MVDTAEPYDVIIIGAGITGLVAGYKLAKEGKRVLILEKKHQCGGMLRSYKTNNYEIEQYYHHVFETDKYLLEFLQDIGLKDRLVWRQALSGFLVGNKLFKLSSPFDIIKFKPLSFFDKINFCKISDYRKISKSYFWFDHPKFSKVS